MTPRGSTSENFIERKDVDYAIAPEIVEVGTFPSRKSSTLAKRGVASNAAVHELLERPICMNVMCPPIHQIFNCFGFQFCLHFEALNIGTAPVYMAFIRFMGDYHDAKKFSYSLEVGGNGRKLTWHRVPRSIRESRIIVKRQFGWANYSKKHGTLFLWR